MKGFFEFMSTVNYPQDSKHGQFKGKKINLKSLITTVNSYPFKMSSKPSSDKLKKQESTFQTKRTKSKSARNAIDFQNKKSTIDGFKKKANQSSSAFYKEACQLQKCTMNSAISNGLKGTEFVLNVDNLNTTDTGVLSILLHSCNFTSIILTGNTEYDGQQFHDQHQKYIAEYRGEKTFNEISTDNESGVRKSSKKGRNNLQIPLSRRDMNTFLNVMESVSRNIGTGYQELTNIKIMNLEMRSEGLSYICEGLKTAHNIKEMYIQNCGLTASVIEQGMLPYMKEIKSLTLLDLSFNKLDGESGRLIGKLLSAHSRNRDEHMWLCGLRGEVPENDVNLEGICEINLMGNLLNDKSIKELCQFLQYDGWTRSINVRFNRIGAEGLYEIDKMLDNNENLISLDIRNNPGMTPSMEDYEKFGDSVVLLSKSIYDKLLKNIKRFKHNRDKMRRKQQDQIISNLQYSNNNTPVSLMIPSINNNHYEQSNFSNVDPSLQSYLANQSQQHQEQFQQFGRGYSDVQQIATPEDLAHYQQQISLAEAQQHHAQLLLQQQQLHQQYQPIQTNDNEIKQDDQNDEEEQEEAADDEEQEGEEEGEEIQLSEEQQYIYSEEFLEYQHQIFINYYGSNEEFQQLSDEQQKDIFQQFFLKSQEDYLLNLQVKESFQVKLLQQQMQQQQQHMEGVEEVQNEEEEEELQHQDIPEQQNEEEHEDNVEGEDENLEQQEGEALNEDINIIQQENEEEDHEGDNHFQEQQNFYQQPQKGEAIGFQKSGEQEQLGQNLEEELHNGEEGEGEQRDEEREFENAQAVIMQQLYEELGLSEIANKNCDCCLQLQDKLIQAEYEKLNLLIELKNTKSIQDQLQIDNQELIEQIQLLQNHSQQQQLQQSSQQEEQEDFIPQEQQENIISSGQIQQSTSNNQEGEDMLNRIEGLMTELTRLMENLENVQQNNLTNNNITCQLSNTSNTNNQTHQLLNSNPNINFTNILGVSQNTSNILPRNSNSAFSPSHSTKNQPNSLQQQQQQIQLQQQQQQQQQLLLQQQQQQQFLQLHHQQLQIQQQMQMQQQKIQNQHQQQQIQLSPLQQFQLQQQQQAFVKKQKKTNKKSKISQKQMEQQIQNIY